LNSFGAAKKKRSNLNSHMSDSQGAPEYGDRLIGIGLAYPGNRLPTFSSTYNSLGHAAAFPVGLPEFFCNAFTDDGDTVFDPFCGSGSTLIAAEQTKRRGLGIEISPAYVDVCVARWQAFTGERATLDGHPFDDIAVERRQETAA
jgi:DNA modification methylase